MRFKVGDKVVWCGVQGVIVQDYHFKSEYSASLLAEFWPPKELSLAPEKKSHTFMYDGRLHHWHLQPSLRLLDAEMAVERR